MHDCIRRALPISRQDENVANSQGISEADIQTDDLDGITSEDELAGDDWTSGGNHDADGDATSPSGIDESDTTETDAPSDGPGGGGNSGGLSRGAIAGIVVAAVAVFLILVIICCCCLAKRTHGTSSGDVFA